MKKENEVKVNPFDNDRCTGCSRRDFMAQLGVLAGLGILSSDALAMLPPAVNRALIPSKAGAKKVRVIFSHRKDGEIQIKADWPNLGYDFRPVMKNMVDALNWQIKGIEFVPAQCADAEEAQKIVQMDDANDEFVGFVFVQLNCWNPCICAYRHTSKAVFYTPLPYGGDGGWLRNTSKIRAEGDKAAHCFCFAAFDFSKVVQVAKAFEVFANGGTVADYRAKAELYSAALIPPDTLPAGVDLVEDKIACRTPDATLSEIGKLKVLCVETAKDADVSECAATFGIQVECVKFEELNGNCRAVSDAAAQRVVDAWKRRASRIEYVEDETLLMSAKVYLGMKETLRAHGAHAITVNCLGGCYRGKLDGYPCLGFMELQDEGLMGVCENDLDSTITMLAFSALANGRVGYVSDPALDMPNRVVSYAHCVSTRRFFGPKGPEASFEILTHSEDRAGASVRAFAPIGHPVTTVKFSLRNKKVALSTGVIIANDTDDRACRTKIVARVKGDYSKMSLHWQREAFNWHRVTFIGDMKEAVEAFAKRIGYEVVRES